MGGDVGLARVRHGAADIAAEPFGRRGIDERGALEARVAGGAGARRGGAQALDGGAEATGRGVDAPGGVERGGEHALVGDAAGQLDGAEGGGVGDLELAAPLVRLRQRGQRARRGAVVGGGAFRRRRGLDRRAELAGDEVERGGADQRLAVAARLAGGEREQRLEVASLTGDVAEGGEGLLAPGEGLALALGGAETELEGAPERPHRAGGVVGRQRQSPGAGRTAQRAPRRCRARGVARCSAGPPVRPASYSSERSVPTRRCASRRAVPESASVRPPPGGGRGGTRSRRRPGAGG